MNRESLARRLAVRFPSSERPAVPRGLVGEFERVDSDVGGLWFPTSDDVMRPFIARTGSWEKEEAALLRSLARPAIRFLDVGANVGYFTLMMAKIAPQAELTAVEPHPLTVELLRMNLWEAAVSAEVFAVALTAGPRSVVLSTSSTNLGETRASLPGAGSRASLVAAGVTGDMLFRGRAFDLIKIDVQGFEPDVIDGLSGVIRRSPGLVVVAEYWPGVLRSSGRDPRQVLERYEQLGFDIVVQIGDRLDRMTIDEILTTSEGAGPDGSLNLVLRRS